MAAGNYNITIGADEGLDLTFTYKDANGNPVDLTNYHATLQVRPGEGNNTLYLEFDDTGGGTAGCSIVLGGAAGTIQIIADITQMVSFLTFEKAKYTLLLHPPATVKRERLLQGDFIVDRGITPYNA